MLGHLFDLIDSAHLFGGAVHDARIMASCRRHAIRELWSADRDFAPFSGGRIRNPLVS